MRSFSPKAANGRGPESIIQDRIILKLKSHDWYCKVIHGNAFQFGLPDLFAAHINYGQRWIEVKNPLSWSFTESQIKEFPKLAAHGVGIWILFSDDASEMNKLFEPANWFKIYYKKIHNL
jgi:hypothetical protein